MPGSSFRCSLDGRHFKLCISRYKAELDLGKHVLLVKAISPAGIVDPTPAELRFRRAPKHD